MHGDVLSARSVNGATIVHVESVDGVRTMSGGRIAIELEQLKVEVRGQTRETRWDDGYR